ncbi:MAG: hypothetical protein ABJC13_24020 [Acidobacteriota bacterium]
MRTKPKDPEKGEAPEARLRLALDEFFSRIARKSHPEGEWQEGLWQPSPQEVRACCEAIRPSTANRQALESHCRSQAHVAELFGVALSDLKAAVKAERMKQAAAPEVEMPESDFSRVAQNVRNFSVRQVREQAREDLPKIKRLRDLEVDEDLPLVLAAARKALEGLLTTIRVAQTMETGLQDLGLVFSKPKPQEPAVPIGADVAKWDDPAEGDPLPRRVFEAAAARAA